MNELVTANDSSIEISKRMSANLALAKERLLDFKTDIERLEIRDFARKSYNIAVAAELNEIAVEAANLIQLTERKIAEANPPNPGGKGVKVGSCVVPDDAINPSTLRDYRQVHDNLSDAEFEELAQESIETGKPLTRKRILEYIDNSKAQKIHDERGTCKEEIIADASSGYLEYVRKIIESGDVDAMFEIYPELKTTIVRLSNYLMGIERFIVELDNQSQ